MPLRKNPRKLIWKSGHPLTRIEGLDRLPLCKSYSITLASASTKRTIRFGTFSVLPNFSTRRFGNPHFRLSVSETSILPPQTSVSAALRQLSWRRCCLLAIPLVCSTLLVRTTLVVVVDNSGSSKTGWRITPTRWSNRVDSDYPKSTLPKFN